MSMTDFRAMCAELLAAIQLYTKLNPAASDMSPFELTEKLMDAMAATNAALAQPVAQPPADGEVGELVAWLRAHADEHTEESDGPYTRAADLLERFASPVCYVLDPSPDALALLEAAGPGRIERLPAHMQLIEPAERTMLVPAAQPVAVSERLPGAEDCDELDNCWQWEPDINGHPLLGAWVLQHRDWPSNSDGDATHWLPFNALPLPQGNDN